MLWHRLTVYVYVCAQCSSQREHARSTVCSAACSGSSQIGTHTEYKRGSLWETGTEMGQCAQRETCTRADL